MRSIVIFLLGVLFLFSMPMERASATALDDGDNPTCQSEFFQQMGARARLQAELDYEAATTLIVKPDSVLEYSCFERNVKIADLENKRMPSGIEISLPIGDMIEAMMADIMKQVEAMVNSAIESVKKEYGGGKIAGKVFDYVIDYVSDTLMPLVKGAIEPAVTSATSAMNVNFSIPDPSSSILKTLELPGIEGLVEKAIFAYAEDQFPHGFLGGAIPTNDLCASMNAIMNASQAMNMPSGENSMFGTMAERLKKSGERELERQIINNSWDYYKALQLLAAGLPAFTAALIDAEDDADVDASNVENIGPFTAGVAPLEDLLISHELHDPHLHCREMGVNGWASSHVPYAQMEVSGGNGEIYVQNGYGNDFSGTLWMLVPKSEVGRGEGYYGVGVDGIGMWNGGLQSFANIFPEETNFEESHRWGLMDSPLSGSAGDGRAFEGLDQAAAESLSRSLRVWRPTPGRTYGFMVLVGNGESRTNIVQATWPRCPGGAGLPDILGGGVVIPEDIDNDIEPDPEHLYLSDTLTKSYTKGSQVGGSLTSEGYMPGTGENHILYVVPKALMHGAVEFEVKGMKDNVGEPEHGFFAQYDGRGIREPINYSPDFKDNFFRWNVHYRQNEYAIKGVVNNALPTTQTNDSKAVFPTVDLDGDGLTDRDWSEEPTGARVSWDPTAWYKFRIEWNATSTGTTYSVKIDGSTVWSLTSPYPYEPKDRRMWLGSGPGKYDSAVSGITYRKFKIYDYDE